MAMIMGDRVGGGGGGWGGGGGGGGGGVLGRRSEGFSSMKSPASSDNRLNPRLD